MADDFPGEFDMIVVGTGELSLSVVLASHKYLV